MSVQVISYSDEHIDGVRDLILPIQREEYSLQIAYEDQPDLHDIPGFYQQRKGGFWIAVDGPVVVGSIGLIDIGGNLAALRKMFVKKAYRGPRHGVANSLLQSLIDHANGRAVRDIYLGTTSRFLAAHRFYEKAGFDLVDAADLPKNFLRMAVDTRFYRLRLP